MRIDSSGNVGIGTTSPNVKLDVLGSVRSNHNANNYIQLESNSGGGVLSGVSSGVVTTLVRTYGDSYFNGGNFGIGTTSPSTKLHIAAASSNSQLTLERTGSATGKYLIYTNTNNLYFNNVASSTFPLTILNSGNVGIGTATPTAKLQVVGLAEHADNSAATTAGLTAGAFYRTGDLLKVVH